MKISVLTNSTSTPRQRATYPDPFDPMRRGMAFRPGQRGPVLTRRQRQARDEPAALGRRAAERHARERAEWIANIASQERTHESGPNRSHVSGPTSLGWPLPLNPAGQVVDSVMRLYAQYEPAILDGAHRLCVQGGACENVDERPADGRPMRVVRAINAGSASVSASGAAHEAPATQGVSPSAEQASIGELAVLAWVGQRCSAITQITQLARGAPWSIGQALASGFLLSPCKVILDRTGNVTRRAALAAANETGIELRLTMGRRLGTGPVPVVPTSVFTSVPDPLSTPTDGEPGLAPARTNRTTRFLSAGAGSLGIMNVPAGEHREVADALANLWTRLDEVLMSPCGSGARAEIGQGNYSQGQQKAWATGGAVCDLLYNASPAGSTFSLAGYAVHALRKVVSGEWPDAPPQDQFKWFSLHKPGLGGVVQVGQNSMIWTQGTLQRLEESAPGRGHVVNDRRSAPGVARMPALPVERTELGWELTEIPDAYQANVDISDEDFANSPDQIVRLSPNSGYARIDGKTYEVENDLATTRWRIVPPDDAHGVSIAIGQVAGERRWEILTLLGAGDPPPLGQRFEERHQALLAGPESDAYRDAHSEEYDPELNEGLYADQPLPVLMLEFAESSDSPHELGQLHQYVETRRMDDLLGVIQEGIARSFAMPDGGLAYMRGLVLPRSTRIPGFEHDMDARRVMELAVGGDLSPIELGATLGRVVERRLIEEMHGVAESIGRAPDRLFMGELRSNQISVPRISAEASFEERLYHFLEGGVTDTQRGALLPLIRTQAEQVWAPLEALRLRVAGVRAHENEAAFLEGYEDFESIPIDGLDSRTELLPAIDIAMAQQTPTLLGAAWRYVELQEIEARQMMEDVVETPARMEADRDDFRRGFNDPASIELPWGALGSSAELSVAFHGEHVTLAQQGALYRRFLEQSMLERIERQVEARSVGVDAARVQRGRERPERVELAALPEVPSLEDIAVRIEQPGLTPEQTGALYAHALERMGTIRREQVGAIRRRMFRDTQLADYIDGYLNPVEDAPPVLLAARSIDETLDLFRNDVYSARARGQIARRIASLEEENDSVVMEHLVMAQIYRHAVTTSRTEFSQSIIPSMLKGLLDGQCYSFAATMSVAMHRGTESVRAFVARIRAFEVLRARTPPGEEPVERFVLGVESRNVLAALAELSVRQPRAPDALAGGELTQVGDWMHWTGIADFLYEQAYAGHADHLIGTAEHVLAVRIEILPGRVRRERIMFYEPDYGLLEFGSLRDFRNTLERAGATPFYREYLQGGDPGVDIFRVDPERLGRVRVYGHLTVRDLADSQPFLRAVQRPSEEGMAVARPVPGGQAGHVEEQEPEGRSIESAGVGEDGQPSPRHVQLEEVHQVAADGGNWAWMRARNDTDVG